MSKPADDEATWWEEEAARIEDMGRRLRESGAVEGEPAKPVKLDEDGAEER